MEKNHSFIQWLFPNSFQSRFNPRSHPLTESEAIIFRSTAIIANRYVKSYEMMLGFYGMKLKNKRTGEITHCRRNNYRDRYHKTLLTSFHNHMRITRILASLVMVGFARYARELSRFLYSEIYDIQGDLKELKNFRIY